jgi:hypothetical protein
MMTMLVGYEEILKEEKRSLSRQTQVLDFSKSSSGPLASPHILDIGDETRQGMVTMLAGYEEILKEEKRSLSRQT